MSGHQARVPVPTTAAPAAAPPSAAAAPTSSVPAAPAPVAGLVVGHADDPAEHAADARADAALARLRSHHAADDPAAAAHRHDPGCGHLRRSTAPTAPSTAQVGLEGGDLDSATTTRIESRRAAGAPLPGAVRRRMETAFGTSLGHVRMHDDAESGRLNAAMSAQAFTTGRDIFFGAGQFAPGTETGDHVIAHEIAHVLAEGAPVRRLFGLGKTPEEKAAEKKRKADEAEKARRAKAGKKTEKTEQSSLKESRKVGDAGRAALGEEIHQGDDAAHVQSAAKMAAKGAEFNKALTRESEVFDELKAAKPDLTDEKAAELAYHQVWYDEFPQLNAVRPARETAAERLVRAVRDVRTDAVTDEAAAAQDKATLKVRMLSKNVETAYDRMVTVRDEELAKTPEGSPALLADEARKIVLKTLDPKVLAELPKRDGPLDVAAWTQAEARVAARENQKRRDTAAYQANMALLKPEQQGPQQEKADSIAKQGADTLDEVSGYASKGKTAIKTVGGGIAKQIGKSQDKDLRAGLPKSDAFNPKSPVPKSVDRLGLGGAITSGMKADYRVKHGQREDTASALRPTSDATKASQGIGYMTGILTDLLDAVQSVFSMASSIENAWGDKDPYEAIKATKAGASSLGSLVDAATRSANLAKVIDAGVSSGVASVVPGLDIAAAAISMVKGVTDVATAGMRQHETDDAMFEARAGSTDKVNVMVYPLMKVSQVYTKHLEKACWSLGVSVLDFSVSVAQVATAGGYGIPAAIKASAKVVDQLHKVGHYIASKVLAVMAKRAERDSSVLHVEGGAEDELKRHPKMAVDGIVIRAAQGDKVALAFLANYRIDGKPITKEYVQRIKPKPVRPLDPRKPEVEKDATSDDGLLLKIRESVFAGLDTKEDPQSVFDDFRKQASKISDAFSDASSTWAETGELAEQRNALAKDGKLGENTKTDRGLPWRVAMLLKSEKRGKLSERTKAYGDTEALPQGVACAVGDKTLSLDADPSAIAAFTEALTVEAIEAEIARTPRRNSPEWIDFLREALRTKHAASKPTSTWKSAKPSGMSTGSGGSSSSGGSSWVSARPTALAGS
jgi:hypothetical protein